MLSVSEQIAGSIPAKLQVRHQRTVEVSLICFILIGNITTQIIEKSSSLR